jgi:flagellar protein FlaG
MPDPISVLAATAAPAPVPGSGRSLPSAPSVAAPTAPADPSASSLQAAVSAIAKHFDAQQSQVRFRIDEDTHRLVVSVVDAVNGAVLIQIPSQDALDIAKSIERTRAAIVQRVA